MNEHSTPPLIAEELARDPRFHQAKELLLQTIASHQAKLTGIKPAQVERRQSYEELLEAFAKLRGGALWFPYIGSGVGHGALVELLDGSVKYDLISGIGPLYFGHSHPLLVASSIDAALSDLIMQGNLQQNVDSYQLIKHLVEASGMDHCFLSTSGAMANENALKIAFQRHEPANRVLAFEHAFSGRTITASQITDKPAYREGLPSTLFVDYIPFYHAEDPEGSTAKSLKVLKEHLSRHPKKHAAMLLELVQGEGGFYAGSTSFFTAIMEVLKEANIAIIVDEVQTFGRTERLFAFQYFGLEKYVDIVTVGKVSQVCATLFKGPYKPKPGLLSQTFTGSTSAIKASLAMLETMERENFFGKKGLIATLHHAFVSGFEEIAKRHPGMIQGPYGIGGMIAFTPYHGDAHLTTAIVKALFHAGVISFTAGSHPTRIRFLIPIGALTTQDIAAILPVVEETLLQHQSKA